MANSIQTTGTGHEVDCEGWFFEKEVMWKGQRFGLKVKETLLNIKSDFQHILVLESETYGRVLVLDGVIQLTERDECSYQESITHTPLFAHPCPKRVLIIGGGDGGVLREVCRHGCVTEIVQCEIDPEVIRVAKEFFGDITATSFGDPRLTLVHQDAADFLAGTRDKFDVVLIDSSDPVGPAESLFSAAFYASVSGALSDDGIMAAQGECLWLHLDLLERVLTDCAKLFHCVDYYYCGVPTYPCGQIGFVLGCKSGIDLRRPTRSDIQVLAQLQYYNAQVHEASFALPQFAAARLSQLRSRSSAPPAIVAPPVPPNSVERVRSSNRYSNRYSNVAIGCVAVLAVVGTVTLTQLGLKRFFNKKINLV